MGSVLARAALAGMVLMLLPSWAWAQSTGSIAGTVKDASGGVLPGVTVEASSPALIEKVRTVISDSQGNYNIGDLRPGAYVVTFTLPGFATVRREGVQLSSGFTANVSVEMKVGGVEETIVVTGAAPVVDVQNVSQQRVINRALIDSLPTNKTFQGLAVLIPGVVSQGQDVGGSTMSGFGVPLTVHGSKGDEMPMMLDGLKFSNMQRAGGGSSMLYRINSAVAEEITVQVSGMSAEGSEGGLIINTVPKEGGNVFHGSFFANYANHKLESKNLTPALIARGARSGSSVRKRYEVNGAAGGPVKQDRLWFFAGVRQEDTVDRRPNQYYAVDAAAVHFTPDLSKPLDVDAHYTSLSGRLTWQATQKNKFSTFYDRQPGCICPLVFTGNAAGEAAGDVKFTGNYIWQLTWKAPMTNRLLFDAGTGVSQQKEYYYQFDELGPRYSITELSTGFLYHGPPNPTDEISRTWSGRAAMSYVTGSHAVKVGSQWMYGFMQRHLTMFDDKQLRFLNGVPDSVVVWTTPYSDDVRTAPNLSLFAQDQWKIRRVTLNAGVRYEYVHSYTPAYHQGPVQYVGARDFDKIDNVPNWKDIVPRIGAAWDVFGNGRTAVKGSLGKYVSGMTGSIARLLHPTVTSVNATTRRWTDTNGDYIPQESELGPLASSTFGQTLIRTRFDPDFLVGWNKRPYNWEGTASVQHEVADGVSVTAAFVRRWRGNLAVTDNLAVAPSDYDTYCITGPTDSRLPGGGGERICDLWDIKPSKFGQVNNLVTLAKNYGKNIENWQGVDLTLVARLPKGALLQGGTSAGRQLFDNCDIVGKVDNGAAGSSTAFGGIINFANSVSVASPSARFCHNVSPYLWQFKLAGAYPLPWAGIELSGTLQSNPGPPINALYLAPNSVVAPSLGRNLAGNVSTASVELIEPNQLYGDRLNQVDFRLTKTFALRTTKWQAQLDLYNALNASPVLGQVTTFGGGWLFPFSILPPRLIKIGMQFDF